MTEKPRKRRSTFSNVVGFSTRPSQLEPDETPSPHDTAGMDSAGTALPETNIQYYRIAGSHVLEGDEPIERRRGSKSTIDSSDLLDHRREMNGTKNKPKYGRPSIVERWSRRRSSMSRAMPHRGAYTGIPSQGNSDDEQETRDSFAISLDNDTDSDGGSRGGEETGQPLNSEPSSRRSSGASSLDDVCFPIDSPQEADSTLGTVRMWPDLEVLKEFADEEVREMERVERAEAAATSLSDDGELGENGIRSYSPLTSQDRSRYAVNEAEVNGGRLRPHRIIPWTDQFSRQTADRLPGFDEKSASELRFTYFREDMEATVHSPTISGLLQTGQTFADLFPPVSRVNITRGSTPMMQTPMNTGSEGGVQLAQEQTSFPPNVSVSSAATAASTNNGTTSPSLKKESMIDPIPFWLDVLNPTEEEMKVLSKTFGIHPLTTEDIFLGETREKVELFKNYYLVCFRSIDVNSSRREKKSKVNVGRSNSIVPTKQLELRRRANSIVSISSDSRRRKHSRTRKNELRPLNMYIIVFHEGVLTFHFAPTPHLINVRRRARLLRDYITVSSDWISYAIIDDITDGFAPMIEAIEDEVNEIEDLILKMHSGDSSDDESDDDGETESLASVSTAISRNKQYKEKGDMLRRIGEVRKRVMSLLRLLGNKADVIKGFAKRCNQQWEVAPRNEIGLYLGDIQDHIVTMVQSLNHYEKLLARSHSNYLAQINIDMTKVNNDMNDVLSKITVLGTIVLPMNIVTGLWGMNVLVPGQNVNSLNWFWAIVALLGVFGVGCAWVARRFL